MLNLAQVIEAIPKLLASGGMLNYQLKQGGHPFLSLGYL